MIFIIDVFYIGETFVVLLAVLVIMFEYNTCILYAKLRDKTA